MDARASTVLAITDHVVEQQPHVTRDTFGAYLQNVEEQAERGRRRYGLLVIPGLELTVEDLGLRTFVPVDGGLDSAWHAAREAGAALIAAHPYPLEAARTWHRGTARFAVDPVWAVEMVDRFELYNRDERFDWVAECKLPALATVRYPPP
jgi:hypothetical protein